jgi:hypothetical protein
LSSTTEEDNMTNALSIETIATMTRTELRHAIAALLGSCPSEVRNSRAKMRALLEASIEEPVAEEPVERPSEDASLAEKVEWIARAFASDESERVVCPIAVLADLGMPKTAQTYGWYWNADHYGKPNKGKASAEALGYKAGLRKIDGERALVLTPIAA